MPKDLTVTIQTEIAKEENIPIHLFELELVSGTLYFCDWNEDIIFGGHTYTAWSVSFSPAKVNISLEIDSISVNFDNTDLTMSAYLKVYPFQNRKINIKRVFSGLLSNANDYILIFSGIMNTVSVDENILEANAVSALNILHKEIPKRMYQPPCPWTFAGTCYCQANTDQKDGTADSGTLSELVDNALAEIEDYWKDGVLEMLTGDNAGEKRKILSFYAPGDCVTVVYAFSNVVSAGDCYRIKRGCDKTAESCEGRFDNLLHFGGFPTVPRTRGEGT